MFQRLRYIIVLITCIALSCASYAQDAADLKSETPPENGIWLDSLDLSKTVQTFRQACPGRSSRGNPITLAGVVYPHGLGVHALSYVVIDLKGQAARFMSMVGLDDEVGKTGGVNFQVWVDGKKITESGLMRGGDTPKLISADLKGAKTLKLVVDDADDNIWPDNADWAGAVLIMNPGATARPEVIDVPATTDAPIASGISPEPRINGPRVVGTTPGRSFLFLIAATGDHTLKYSARNMPEGLSLDPNTGIITGSVKRAGEYKVGLAVKGPKGTAERELKIVAGKHKLALTPPMGWNSWNCWGGNIDDAKIRAAADWMVKSGLAAHGYQYINIDDCWQAGRDADGKIKPNASFPDMKALADYVHSKGLRIGIYSSPGPKTCGGHEGSLHHEEQDALTWSEWGMDYVKHDWCSYSKADESLEEFQKPYKVMRAALDKCDRDIVYSLCQYGWKEVWKWGAEVGGNCWRTTSDINDSWASLSSIAFSQDDKSPFAQPGHWNDPDMLVVGKVGWGTPRANLLSQDEQITHITMWSILAAPMLLGCDMSQLDQFTIDLMSNDEVIDVNQDVLGKGGRRLAVDGLKEVWAKPLSDGALAVALFNRADEKASVTADWKALGISGKQAIRNLWQKKDLGPFTDSFTTEVEPHGAVLVRLTPAP